MSKTAVEFLMDLDCESPLEVAAQIDPLDFRSDDLGDAVTRFQEIVEDAFDDLLSVAYTVSRTEILNAVDRTVEAPDE